MDTGKNGEEAKADAAEERRERTVRDELNGREEEERRRRRRKETRCLSLPTLQATVSDGSIEFVGLVALCGLPSRLLPNLGYFYRTTPANSYVKHRLRYDV